MIAIETKICTKCGRELPIEEFNWRNKEKGTRRSECKYCHSNFMNNLYMDKKQIISDIKQNLKCEKCGESKPYCLDFHHTDPKKKEGTIAKMISNNYRLNKILDEIKKCRVLCANCHREFHYLNNKNNITIENYLSGDFIFDDLEILI